MEAEGAQLHRTAEAAPEHRHRAGPAAEQPRGVPPAREGRLARGEVRPPRAARRDPGRPPPEGGGHAAVQGLRGQLQEGAPADPGAARDPRRPREEQRGVPEGSGQAEPARGQLQVRRGRAQEEGGRRGRGGAPGEDLHDRGGVREGDGAREVTVTGVALRRLCRYVCARLTGWWKRRDRKGATGCRHSNVSGGAKSRCGRLSVSRVILADRATLAYKQFVVGLVGRFD